MRMNTELLKQLTEAHGVPGQEDAIRAIVKRELESFCEVSVDAMGNLIALKRGTASAPEPRRAGARQPKSTRPKRIMLAAHMDEIGFIVRYIDDKGFLRLQPLGGWDPRQMASQRVLVHARGGALPGVLMASTKPKHMLTAEEAAKPPAIENYFVDVGLSGTMAKKRIRPGDMVTMNRTFQQMGNLMTGKSMDDRVAIFVMIEALKRVKKHSVDVYAVATVQEEVGLRGAAASGWSIAPDVVIALDITLANDYPGIPETDQVTSLGSGAAIKIMDSSLICHPKVVDHFRRLAEKFDIKHQMEVLPMGGTDAGGVQRLHGGIPAFTLSIPTRYVHTVNETVHTEDVRACIELLAKYIADAHNGAYAYS
jgi:endoglucanase